MAVVEPRPGLSDKVGVCITDDARVSYGGGYTGCTYAGMCVARWESGLTRLRQGNYDMFCIVSTGMSASSRVRVKASEVKGEANVIGEVIVDHGVMRLDDHIRSDIFHGARVVTEALGSVDWKLVSALLCFAGRISRN